MLPTVRVSQPQAPGGRPLAAPPDAHVKERAATYYEIVGIEHAPREKLSDTDQLALDFDEGPEAGRASARSGGANEEGTAVIYL